MDEACLAFEKILTYATHFGLYAEEISHTGEQLNNFSQAFIHLALISAAFNLDRTVLTGGSGGVPGAVAVRAPDPGSCWKPTPRSAR
ncbi:hypothetical protein HEP84_56845 [Streptomyces sp. RLB1-33]|nr:MULTISPECIES: hypothetical protein [Streptomyces]